MPFSEIALIFRWILPLWALGWLVLPLSSRLFPFLPDKGLSAGRVAALALLSLGTFWGAAIRLIPLSVASFALIIVPIVGALGWKNAAFRAQIAKNWRRFLVSDVVFLLIFGLFLWVRLRNPNAADLEKPMDMALLSAAMRADFLPFPNPWLAGEAFTNYYYFGPLMAALVARALQTPPYLAYNLAQPLFCALFASVLWSLGAALGKSSKVGLGVVFLVALGGHFEPLRQIAQSGQIWPLDWWKTSRVIENTINEYPAFTLLVGDLHAHFYALSLATTHFCLCLGLLMVDSARLRSLLLLLGGVFVGLFALTNTWDAPLYGLLWLGCALWSRRSRRWTAQNLQALVGAMVLAPLVALPYFLRFKSQVSGVAFDFWVPDLTSFGLLWGSWWMLGFWALLMPSGEKEASPEAIFRGFLMAVGVVALLFPFFFYLRGYFGDGDLRHQDTVFKFGLQAWLLLGIGIAAEAGFRFRYWWKSAIWPLKFASATTVLAFLAVVSLAPLVVGWARTVRDAPRNEFGLLSLSLNAAGFLGDDELAGIEWLRRNAKDGDSVVEAVSTNAEGQPTGDYNPTFGRVAAFSGVPSVLGWPQHVWMWGASWDEINRRAALVNEIYRGSNQQAGLGALQKSGAEWVFLGLRERGHYGFTPNLEIGKNGVSLTRSSGDPPFTSPQILRFKRPIESN